MMDVHMEWPDVDLRGLVRVELTRSDLARLTRMLDCRSFGTPGIVSISGEGASEILSVVTVREDAA